VNNVIAALEGAGVSGFVIGKILTRDEGLVLLKDGCRTELPQFSRDEIARFFATKG
jgi:hypothetical protein